MCNYVAYESDDCILFAQVKQKVNVEDFLSLIYISIDGVTEGMCALPPFFLQSPVSLHILCI